MSDVLRMGRDFSSAWPGVLEEMLDYIHLQLMLAGAWETVEIRVLISRQQVRADELQPHVGVFRTALESTLRSKVVLQASDERVHRADLNFWR